MTIKEMLAEIKHRAEEGVTTPGHDTSLPGICACVQCFCSAILEKVAEGEKRESELLSVLEGVLEMVEQGPCCGSGDELTSHYHCWQCGKVGGMYVCNAVGGNPNCKPNPENEYVKRTTILGKAAEFVESRNPDESQKA